MRGGQRHMFFIQADEVCRRPNGNRAAVAAQRLRAAGESDLHDSASGRLLILSSPHSARDGLSRCEYSSRDNSAATLMWTLESVPTPKRPSVPKKLRDREHAVAQVRFGHRAQTDDRAAGGDPLCFRGRHDASRERGTNFGPPGDVPAAIRPDALPGPGTALLDLAHLFGDVDVDGRRACSAHDGFELFRRHGTQAVRGNTNHYRGYRSRAAAAAALQQPLVAFQRY